MIESNKWGLQFTEIDHENQEIKTLLYITAEEEQVKATFENIKKQFKENEGDKECAIDLIDVDDNESIVDDYPLTKMQLESAATLLGFELSKKCISKTVEEAAKWINTNVYREMD